jgi:hypothetical protein
VNTRCRNSVSCVCGRLQNAVVSCRVEVRHTLTDRRATGELHVRQRASSHTLRKAVVGKFEWNLGLRRAWQVLVAVHVIVESLGTQHLADGPPIVFGTSEWWCSGVCSRCRGTVSSGSLWEAWCSLRDPCSLNIHTALCASITGNRTVGLWDR